MKIRKIQFSGHPVLGDLKLDFTDQEGKVIDTIILAGDNGTGKSLLLNTIFDFSDLTIRNDRGDEKRFFEIELSDSELELLKNITDFNQYFQEPINNTLKIAIDYSIINRWDQVKITAQKNNGDIVKLPGHLFTNEDTRKILICIFSDAEINFTPNRISNVTSQNIDFDNLQSVRSSINLATEITQLLIDIQSIDALEFTEWARQNSGQPVDKNKIDVRTKRFTNAFDYMFPAKKYKRIDTVENQKEIIFDEYGKEMDIADLSSGEKQIVFRGSFLLKDKMSSKGALILIDEPEISMHPTWQLKVLTFFKKLFSDEGGLTSQLIVATHSPFIIHNANRNEDKVIVLQKDDDGKISVVNDPQFYSWSTERKVREAFKVAQVLRPNLVTVFVEGETDEKYFKKALEIYEVDTTVIDFHWIGRKNESGNAENTGDSALNQARIFFRANPTMLVGKVILLYDSDTNKPEEIIESLEVKKMTLNKANTTYKIGIENLLILSKGFDKKQFYNENVKRDEYSAESIIRKLHKTKLCNYICDELNFKEQKAILRNLKLEIDKLI